MKKKSTNILLVFCSVLLLSFFNSAPPGSAEKIKAYYQAGLVDLLQKVMSLQAAVQSDAPVKDIRAKFFATRMAYKKVEIFLAYYFELDVNKLNGLAINFIEEEDPTAYQQPQGLQLIETFIYPQYNKDKKEQLLQVVSLLSSVVKGLLDNHVLFNPENFAADAAMESLYRIITLGITGFDSPLAQTSIPEAGASLASIRFVVEACKDALWAGHLNEYNRVRKLLEAASGYLAQHPDFNSFDRASFITEYINPVSAAIGRAKRAGAIPDNPAHPSLISRDGELFNKKSLRISTYFYDDTTSDARVQLGKKMFFEPLLSSNGKRSCASCHQPAKAFTDGIPKALQMDEHSVLPRNTPTLWNASLQMNLFYDSRQHRLDDVVMEVLANEKEMNSGAGEALKKINDVAAYTSLFRKAYQATGDSISTKNIANAIAMYIRTLISYNARFDQYMRGDKNKLSRTEIRGFNLFAGKAKCATCHYLPLFNGSKPPTFYYQESEVIGVPANPDLKHPLADDDPGRIHALPLSFMEHAFKTPTLRNIALTAPYMHNGVFSTLRQVIDFYDQGGGQGLGLDVTNQTLPPDKLLLTLAEKKALEAFLLTLTDTSASSY